MPKRESFEERNKKNNRVYTENSPYLEQSLAKYSKIYQASPRLTREEIDSGIKEASRDRYSGQESVSSKISYLKHILKPVDNIFMGMRIEASGEKLVSLRDAYDLYQKLANAYESKKDWENAARNLWNAGVIARKAKAKTTANKLFQKAGELMNKMPLTGNRSPDRNQYLRAGEAYQKMGELSEAETNEWTKKGTYSPNHNAEQGAMEGYEMAGDFKSLERVSKKDWKKVARRGQKKSGKYSELVRSYEASANNLNPNEYGAWIQRYRANAEKTRKLMKKRGITDHSDLESRTAIAASIITILGGFFLLSPNVTGNAIANMTTKTSSGIGAILIILGIVLGFFWLKNRKLKNKKNKVIIKKKVSKKTKPKKNK